MPTQIKCKLCGEIFTSLDLLASKSQLEVGSMLNTHIQERHQKELTNFINNSVAPSIPIFHGLACQNFFSELTDEIYNASTKEVIEKTKHLLVEILNGVPHIWKSNSPIIQ